MQKLKELQKQFRDFIYHDRYSKELSKQILSPSFQDSMSIYRRHVWYSLISTLESHYKTVKIALGDKKFIQIAQDYVSIHPSKTPDLELYGLEFPDFLKNKTPEYISQLAKIDIAYAQASIKPDYSLNSIEEFKNIKQTDYENLIFTTNPTNIECSLSYDVGKYFEYARSNKRNGRPPSVAKVPNIIIVTRNSNNIVHHIRVSILESTFLHLCKKKFKFLDIFQELHKMDKDLNLEKILTKLIEKQLIVKFTIN